MPAGSKPGERRGGRKPGSPNKITTELKEAILRAAELAGNKGGMIAYLQRQASNNPAAFMQLLGKVLPMQVHQQQSGQIKHVIEVRRIIVEPGTQSSD